MQHLTHLCITYMGQEVFHLLIQGQLWCTDAMTLRDTPLNTEH